MAPCPWVTSFPGCFGVSQPSLLLSRLIPVIGCRFLQGKLSRGWVPVSPRWGRGDTTVALAGGSGGDAPAGDGCTTGITWSPFPTGCSAPAGGGRGEQPMGRRTDVFLRERRIPCRRGGEGHLGGGVRASACLCVCVYVGYVCTCVHSVLCARL